MTEPLSLQHHLQNILSSQAFEALEAFKDPISWSPMQKTERELLGQLFVQKGEILLKNGDSHAVDFFNKAAQVASESPKIFYLLGKAYASQEHSVNSLGAALRYFDHSVTLAPTSFEVWNAFGETLLQKGALMNEPEYFLEAQQKFSKAHSHISKLTSPSQANFFWHWGKSFYCSGKLSGEAVDFHGALDKYASADNKGMDCAEFWQDYGDVYFELARLLNRGDLHLKAAECYQRAISLNHDLFEVWRSLGLCYFKLFEQSLENEDYAFAGMSFENGTKLNPHDTQVWLHWARLQFAQARLTGELALLESSLSKFEKADNLYPQQPTTLCYWGEALLYCGALADRIDWLKAAEGKFLRTLELQPENDEAWHLLGSCLNELGRYFSDAQYYRRAIDKFQHGLSINKLSPSLWYGMAASHFSLGDISGDAKMVEKASRFYEKAMENKKTTDPQHWNGWGIVLLKLAEITQEKRNIEDAIGKFEQAILLYSSLNGDEDLDPDLLYNYGCALDFLGDFYEEPIYYEKAIQALSKALQIDPDYVAARYNLALAFSHLGEQAGDIDCFQQSIEQFQFLIAHDREDAMVWSEYGLALLNLAFLVDEPALPHKSLALFEEAEEKLQTAIALGCLQSYYYLACLHSLKENVADAMFYLQKGETNNALPSFEEMARDEWLDNLRDTAAFLNWKERSLDGSL